ncbi:5533_t:CDS:2, partial [Acaulospora colombiana]
SNPTLTIPAMEWKNVGARLTGNAPVGLKDFAIGYYKNTNTMIIFGGTTANGNKNGQTYLANFNNLSWSSPPSSQGPQARSDMLYGMDVWGSYRNTFVISCGRGEGDVIFNDTWAFDMVYLTWTQITDVTSMSGPVPQFYSAIGGIDTTIQTGSQVTPNNTMWISHGTNGTVFFTDLWAQVFRGSWTPNENTLSTVWYKVPTSGVIPQGRKQPAGAILPGGRLAIYGGCNSTGGDCAIPDVSSLVLGNDYNSGIPTSVTKAFWSPDSQCLGSREDAAMVMNGIYSVPAFSTQAIVFGGKLPGDAPIGVDGEVGILDTSSGVWVRVVPQGDGNALPKTRAGARMIATGNTVTSVSSNAGAIDILMFGGEALDNSSTNYNDLWILRLYDAPTSGNNPSNITKTEFLSCIPASQDNMPVMPDNNESDDHGDGGGIGNKFATLLNLKSQETSKSPKSFEVNRSSNKSFHQNEGDSPVSILKPAGDSWVEKRKSVTESANYNTSSRGTMASVASGRGKLEDKDPNDESESENSDSRIINQNLGTGTSHRNIMTNVDEEEELDEETRQAKLEEEITNRDVVVMTIPKRRLTVVNA